MTDSLKAYTVVGISPKGEPNVQHVYSASAKKAARGRDCADMQFVVCVFLGHQMPWKFWELDKPFEKIFMQEANGMATEMISPAHPSGVDREWWRR